MYLTAPKYAYTTLITRSSYFAGVIVLAYSLKKHGSKYPLIVLFTDGLSQDCVSILEKEATHLQIIPSKIEALVPVDIKVTLIAERFEDTWTKLRAFQLLGYEKVCYLDADMMILKSMDSIFDITLPADDWLAASPVCCCNVDRDPWAPADWVPANCSYTNQKHPEALSQRTPVSLQCKPTHRLLNGGTFLFVPSAHMWRSMLDFFNTSPSLAEFKFPDQDFLAEFFRGRWLSIGWQYNALKTMRYFHPNIWRDDQVVCLHYIVDKPWARRIGDDGTAGYRGRDGITHRWWWEMLEDWERETHERGAAEVLQVLFDHVANANRQGDGTDKRFRAIGGEVQAFAYNWTPSVQHQE